MFHCSTDLSKELIEMLELMMTPDPSTRPSAFQLLNHPYLRSRKRWRRLRLFWSRSGRSVCTLLLALLLQIFHILLFLLLPLRALSRKWWCRSGSYVRGNVYGTTGPSTPVIFRPVANDVPRDGQFNSHDFSFSDGKQFKC